jgi:hypothetical protein
MQRLAFFPPTQSLRNVSFGCLLFVGGCRYEPAPRCRTPCTTLHYAALFTAEVSFCYVDVTRVSRRCLIQLIALQIFLLTAPEHVHAVGRLASDVKYSQYRFTVLFRKPTNIIDSSIGSSSSTGSGGGAATAATERRQFNSAHYRLD